MVIRDKGDWKIKKGFKENKIESRKIKALKSALPITVPVLTGYIFLGMGYGILMSKIGYGLGWTLVMSLLVFAGSIQYISIALLTAVFNPIYALLLTLMVNARHIFYGISMLEPYKGTGKLKPYLIFGLTDETFSLLSTIKIPEGVEKKWFMFFVTLLNHSYWVLGSVLGNAIGTVLKFNTDGLDFVLTALFTVIFIDQWKATRNHIPALIGLGGTLCCLLIFGQDSFIIPAMAVIIVLLTVFRRKIDGREGGKSCKDGDSDGGGDAANGVDINNAEIIIGSEKESGDGGATARDDVNTIAVNGNDTNSNDTNGNDVMNGCEKKIEKVAEKSAGKGGGF